jgi:hypothetical protein
MRSVWKTSYLVESQDRGSDFGSFFPSVVDILEVTVEEVLQLVICGLLIEIVPFLCGVDAQPVAISDVLQRSECCCTLRYIWRANMIDIPFVFIPNTLEFPKRAKGVQET